MEHELYLQINSPYLNIFFSNGIILNQFTHKILENFVSHFSQAILCPILYMPNSLYIPSIPPDSFAKKLYSTYLSYLPAEKIAYPLRSNVDNRGSFTELIRSFDHGQVSINIAKPGITKGEHWHNSKWEIFMVVSGHGLIQERRIGTDPETGRDYPVIEFEVTGEQMKAVHMLPGYTHNIINLSPTQDLVTVMWANEGFDPKHPDTFSEPVDHGDQNGT